MAATFFKAKGLEIGNSLVEDDRIEIARNVMEAANTKGVEIILPLDVVVADSFAPDSRLQTVGVEAIPEQWCIMDIGPRTSRLYRDRLQDSGMVLWNGPMGVHEWEPFLQGTASTAITLSSLQDSVTVIGGGSTA